METQGKQIRDSHLNRRSEVPAVGESLDLHMVSTGPATGRHMPSISW
jgi:hypothetical protein